MRSGLRRPAAISSNSSDDEDSDAFPDDDRAAAVDGVDKSSSSSSSSDETKSFAAKVAALESELEDAILSGARKTVLSRDFLITEAYSLVACPDSAETAPEGSPAARAGRTKPNKRSNSADVAPLSGGGIFGEGGTLRMVQTLLDREDDDSDSKNACSSAADRDAASSSDDDSAPDSPLDSDRLFEERCLWRRALQGERLRGAALLRRLGSCARYASRVSRDALATRRALEIRNGQLGGVREKLEQLIKVRESMERQNEANNIRLNMQREAIARLARFQRDLELSEERVRMIEQQRASQQQDFDERLIELTRKLAESRRREEAANAAAHEASAKAQREVTEARRKSKREEAKDRRSPNSSDDEGYGGRSSSRGGGSRKPSSSTHTVAAAASAAAAAANSGVKEHALPELRDFLSVSARLRSAMSLADETALKIIEAELDTSSACVRAQRLEKLRLSQLAVEEARKQSQESKLCCVCLQKDRGCLLLPCRHLCVCTDCGKDHRLKECPLCRSEIESRMDIYA